MDNATTREYPTVTEKNGPTDVIMNVFVKMDQLVDTNVTIGIYLSFEIESSSLRPTNYKISTL